MHHACKPAGQYTICFFVHDILLSSRLDNLSINCKEKSHSWMLNIHTNVSVVIAYLLEHTVDRKMHFSVLNASSDGMDWITRKRYSL